MCARLYEEQQTGVVRAEGERGEWGEWMEWDGDAEQGRCKDLALTESI